MADHSAIEWTEATWNPTTGCTKVSPACAHCYIERTPPFRMAGRKFVKGHIPLKLHTDRLDAPLRKRRPTMYFVNSLSDLFHEDVPETFIDRVFAVMALAPQHTFQVLTKRADRMRLYAAAKHRYTRIAAVIQKERPDLYVKRPTRWPLPNVWLGVSVENQHFASARIPDLLETPAAVRFISAEPLLGPLDIEEYLDRGTVFTSAGWTPNPALDWVIAGAESGPRIRPTDPEWVRALRDQCVDAGVAFFFKQWGGRTSKAGGRQLDGRTWDEMPRTQGHADRPALSY